ncbi:MAG: hypothetical protein ACRD3B_00560 [Candidatus Sulfotelmatobacter sp.]
MPITVSVVTGQASSHLSAGDPFVWVNPTPHPVYLTNCGGFCAQDNYPVAANSETAAEVNLAPTNWNFTETPTTVWNPGGPHPGLPHIQNPSKIEKEVA